MHEVDCVEQDTGRDGLRMRVVTRSLRTLLNILIVCLLFNLALLSPSSVRWDYQEQ